MALNDQRLQVGPRTVKSSGMPGTSGPNDDNVANGIVHKRSSLDCGHRNWFQGPSRSRSKRHLGDAAPSCADFLTAGLPDLPVGLPRTAREVTTLLSSSGTVPFAPSASR